MSCNYNYGLEKKMFSVYVSIKIVSVYVWYNSITLNRKVQKDHWNLKNKGYLYGSKFWTLTNNDCKRI